MTHKAICFFNTNRQWGGGEKWHLENACGLQARGHRVFIIAYKGSPLYEKARAAGVHAVGLKLTNFSFLNVAMLRAIRDLYARNETGVVIFNLARDLKAGGLAARQAAVPRRIYRRGTAKPVKNSMLNRYMFKHIVTEIIANSEETRRTLVHRNPAIEAQRITVIYNGIDTALFQAVEKKPRQGREFVIGNAGRLSGQKAQYHLIGLAERLRDKGVAFKVAVAGDGELRETLVTETQKKNLQESILWQGFVADMQSFLAGIDVFVLTSHWEGFGFVLVEAMLCGLPVIAFDVSSNPEIVEHEKTGFLVPPYDMDRLVGAVESLRQDPARAREMGRQGRQRALRLFGRTTALDRLEQILFEGAAHD